MIAPTPDNFRAEMARHRLNRAAISEAIGMHPNELSMFLNGVRPLAGWAAHNIGWAFNHTTGQMLFGVNMDAGPVTPPKGRPQIRVRLSTPRRRRRRTWRS